MNTSSNKLNMKETVQIFLERFPEFKSTKYFAGVDEEFPYSVMGGFGCYIADYITHLTDPEKDGKVMKLFDLINELYEGDKGDDEALNLVAIEIFENLVGSKESLQLGYKLLKSKPLKDFNLAKKYCGIKDE